VRIAVIPARGGSKRIPGKNIRPMNGRPLLAWPIEACLKSGLFEHILISTDSEEIAATAIACGAEAPFIRPAELSGDHVPTAPVVEHAVTWAERHWGAINVYCRLYANPFVTPANLERGLNLLLETGADETLGITEFPYPILRAFKLDEEGAVVYAFPEYEKARSQDLSVFYHDAAQFYWHRNRPKIPGHARKALPVILPRHCVVDIDTEEDWTIAEKMHALFLRGWWA
jgi:N-acylneuraminate cytidylyltransferase